uniref:Galactosyltransferase n=1 Tax=Helicobacter pylori TaxID=210 RepID=A0A387K4I5_HELPX|nr:galactosyltransferase [Helicobacter pylori]
MVEWNKPYLGVHLIQVYIISLKESQRRLDTEKLVLESNEKFKGHCAFQIFDAISPKHEDFEKFVQELYDAQSLLKSDWFHSDYCYQELLPQEFGCYLSHYLLWKECVKTNQPVVILEDDVALESNFMQALEDCLKSPFDFVRLYGHYWGGHKTNLCALPIYTEVEEKLIIQRLKRLKHLLKTVKLPPPPQFHTRYATRFLMKRNKTPKNHLILAKWCPKKSLLIKWFLKKLKENSTTSLEIFLGQKCIRNSWQNTMISQENTNEKEAFFLEHFYLTSVYVASTAGYYLTPKGAKTFIEATERFKIIEPVDMFMDNSAYHDIANFTYVPCPISLSEHSLDSTIQKPQKKSLKSYSLPPKKSTFKNLFYYSLNAKKRLKAFHKYSKQYDHLKTPKEV